MKHRGLKAMLCGVVAASMVLGGCTTTEAKTGTNVLGITNTTVTGIVESIDGKAVTLTLGSVVESSSFGGMNMGGGTPPEMPSQDNSSNGSTTGSQPALPSQDNNSNNTNGTQNGQPAMPGNSSQSTEVFVKGDTKAVLTVADASVIYRQSTSADSSSSKSSAKTTETAAKLKAVKEGDILTIKINKKGVITKILITELTEWSSSGNQQMQMGGGAPGGSSSGVTSYDAVKTFTTDTAVNGETFTSTGKDENAILVDGAKASFNNITLTRESSSSTGGDNASFYGVGAGFLVKSGTAYINGGTITTNASGGTGVFAYSDGTAYVANTKITTSKDASGAIHTAGGGKLYAWDLDVQTSGGSAAAIRSDRGGGTMVVNGGSYTSNGSGSPAVYCTADIAVNNAALTANGSEAVCIEGKNSLRLFDCRLLGNMSDNEQNDCTWTIIVYQSMSGDSEVGNSTFQMVGGTLTSKNGGLLYTTNTECTILLSDVDITYSDDQAYFLQCTGNTNKRGWGTSGSNGSDCLFTANHQEMKGNVIWDSISKLDFYMTNGSTLTGAVTEDETYAGKGGSGYCDFYVGSDSKWVVTGNSTLTALYNQGSIVDPSGNTVSVVGKDGTVYVSGTSQYTITVSFYSTTADLSGAVSVPEWKSYEVTKPSELN